MSFLKFCLVKILDLSVMLTIVRFFSFNIVEQSFSSDKS
jgi:hypothetical protein